MFAEDLGLDAGRIDAQMPGQVRAKAQAVEKGAGAEHAIVLGDAAGKIRKRIPRALRIAFYFQVTAFSLLIFRANSLHQIVEQLALIKQRADPHTQNLAQFVIADLLEDATFDEHLVQLRAEHRRRRDALASALQRHGAASLLRWTMPEGGLYFWCKLGGRLQTAHVLARALAESVSFVHGEAFFNS